MLARAAEETGPSGDTHVPTHPPSVSGHHPRPSSLLRGRTTAFSSTEEDAIFPHAVPRRYCPSSFAAWAPLSGIHQLGASASETRALQTSGSSTEALCNNLWDAYSSTPGPDVTATSTRFQAADDDAGHTLDTLVTQATGEAASPSNSTGSQEEGLAQ